MNTAKKNWFIVITVICAFLFLLRIFTAPETRSTKNILNIDSVSELSLTDRNLPYKDVKPIKFDINDCLKDSLVKKGTNNPSKKEKNIEDPKDKNEPEFETFQDYLDAQPNPNIVSDYKNVRTQHFNAPDLDRYHAYGPEIFGRLGYNPNVNMDEYYIQNTDPSVDIRRAKKGMFETINIGIVNTIFMTSGFNDELITEIEEVKAIYGSARKDEVGTRSDLIIESGFTIGAFIICFIIPMICWIIYLFEFISWKSDKKRQIRLILNSKETESDYNAKINSLNKLRQLNNINKTEYIEKVNSLRKSLYEKLIIQEQETRVIETQEALEEAFKNGTLTEEEYKQKNTVSDKYEKLEPKIKIDKSSCPVCQNKLSSNEKVCKSCGIVIRQ